MIGTLAYGTKEEVMEWMLDIQLGRRNLSPIQRIAVAEKYRPIYEKQAKERQGTRNDLKNNFTANLPQSSNTKERNPTTDKKLSDIAGVSEKTYRMGAKVLNSSNENVKQRVLSGETSISAGYKELTQGKSEEKVNANKGKNNIPSPTTKKPTTSKTQISEETKQICADLKTEKTKEYLDLDYYSVKIVAILKVQLNHKDHIIFINILYNKYKNTIN